MCGVVCVCDVCVWCVCVVCVFDVCVFGVCVYVCVCVPVCDSYCLGLVISNLRVVDRKKHKAVGW